MPINAQGLTQQYWEGKQPKGLIGGFLKRMVTNRAKKQSGLPAIEPVPSVPMPMEPQLPQIQKPVDPMSLPPMPGQGEQPPYTIGLPQIEPPKGMPGMDLRQTKKPFNPFGAVRDWMDEGQTNAPWWSRMGRV